MCNTKKGTWFHEEHLCMLNFNYTALVIYSNCLKTHYLWLFYFNIYNRIVLCSLQTHNFRSIYWHEKQLSRLQYAYLFLPWWNKALRYFWSQTCPDVWADMLNVFQQVSQTNDGEQFLIANKHTPYLHPATEIKLTHERQITVIFLFEQQPTEI